jgi:peroxiredoxin Q/BCP
MNHSLVGAFAPEFSLSDQHGNTVALKDFRGSKNVLLYFYPKAMTPGCTVQACGLRDIKAELAAQEAVVLAVSPDPVQRLAKFAERDKLNFTLLSDPDHVVADLYGVWAMKKFMGREFMGIVRTSFVIDKRGRIAHVMDKVKTKSHHEEVLALFQSVSAAK